MSDNQTGTASQTAASCWPGDRPPETESDRQMVALIERGTRFLRERDRDQDPVRRMIVAGAKIALRQLRESYESMMEHRAVAHLQERLGAEASVELSAALGVFDDTCSTVACSTVAPVAHLFDCRVHEGGHCDCGSVEHLS